MIRRPRLAYLGIVAVVLLALVACTIEPPPAADPEPTPTETVAEVAPTEPESRVPATCDDLFVSGVVSGGTATALERDGYDGSVDVRICPAEGWLDDAGAVPLGMPVDLTAALSAGIDTQNDVVAALVGAF